jgi:hypothetical protein
MQQASLGIQWASITRWVYAFPRASCKSGLPEQKGFMGKQRFVEETRFVGGGEEKQFVGGGEEKRSMGEAEEKQFMGGGEEKRVVLVEVVFFLMEWILVE